MGKISEYNKTGLSRSAYDFYATNPEDVEKLLQYEDLNGKIWECACGLGHISKVLQKAGKDVFSSDIVDYGFGRCIDFFHADMDNKFDVIITNPPYKLSTEFVEKALQSVKDGGRVIMLLRTLFLESQSRYDRIFKTNNPKTVYVFVKRTFGLVGGCDDNKSSSAMSHSWFIWEKGYKGDTVVRWLV